MEIRNSLVSWSDWHATDFSEIILRLCLRAGTDTFVKKIDTFETKYGRRKGSRTLQLPFLLGSDIYSLSAFTDIDDLLGWKWRKNQAYLTVFFHWSERNGFYLTYILLYSHLLLRPSGILKFVNTEASDFTTG